MSRIIRERHDENYTCIANEALRDSRLGWAARGILAYLLSRPDEWTVILGELIAASPDGRVRVERALDELTACGYLERAISRGRDGRRVVSSTVWERSQWRFPAVVIPLRETDRYEVPKDQSSLSKTDSGRPVWDFLVDDDARGDGAEPVAAAEVTQLALNDARSQLGPRTASLRHLRAATRPPQPGPRMPLGGGARLPEERGTATASSAPEGDR